MNCDFIDLKQESINCKGVNLDNLFFLLYLTGYWATWLHIVPYCVEWATYCWIQLHYFDDAINEFNLIDLKIR